MVDCSCSFRLPHSPTYQVAQKMTMFAQFFARGQSPFAVAAVAVAAVTTVDIAAVAAEAVACQGLLLLLIFK